MRRGFTLIELLAAMAILAVVSVMAVQALGGVFHQRAVLTRIDGRDRALIRTLSLLRQDLEAAVPPPAGTADAPVVFGIEVTPGRLGWLRGGLAPVPGGPVAGVGGVTWALSGTRLTRTVLRSDAEGATAPQGEAVLDGVTAMTLTPLAAEGRSDPQGLAPGYEVILDTETWGALRLVVAR